MALNKFWINKTVAVTGSSGFVGSAIVKQLKQNQIRVVEVSRRAGVDIHNFKQLVTVLEPANYIISTAALDGNSDYKKRNSSYILEENIQITSSILAAASQLGIHDLTMLSSAVIYGSSSKVALNEDYDLILHGDQTLDGYSLSKRMTELLAMEFARKYAGTVLLPRPTNIYGRHDPHSRVIETISQRIIAGDEIKIMGSGRQLLSFVYLDDFVSILLQLIELGVSGPINIASRESVSVLDLAQLIATCLNKKPMLTFTDKDQFQPDRVLDVHRLESYLKYNFTPLKEGLAISLK